MNVSEQEYIDERMSEFWRRELDKGPPTYIDSLLIPRKVWETPANPPSTENKPTEDS